MRISTRGIFLLLTSLSLMAQFETGEVLGTVRDNTGAVVANAAVTLLSQDTAIETKTTSDEAGNYGFFNVKVGTYTITVEHAGFSKFTTADVKVDVTARQRVDVKLQLGQVTESVTVVGVAEVLDTDTSDHSQVINSEAIVELPLNGRDYANLALLATNVHVSPQALAFGPTATPREGAINVNGMRDTVNNFQLDGMDNNSYGTSNQGYSSQVVQPSPDALQEFKVITSNFSAEYGRVGGAVVTAALRSGTNEFHGTLYEFVRNTDLNAIGYQFGLRPATFEKPTLHRNQFGVTIGGPIIKNKLFFFGDYEGYRQLQGYVNLITLPDAAERTGILPATVTNPLTGAVYPANTQIPVGQITPFAMAALAGMAPATTPGLVGNNLEETIPIRDYSDKYDAKLDYDINSKMTSFLRFSQKKDIQYFGPADPGTSGGDGNGFIHSIQQQAAAGYTWTVTPTSLFEVRFGFDHALGGKVPPYLGGPDIAQEFGIKGLPSALEGGFPTQVIGSFTNPTVGRASTNPQFQNPTSFSPKLNDSIVKGRHTLKVGYEFLAIRTEVLDVNPLYGQLTYSGAYSTPAAGAVNCTSTAANCTNAYDLADFYFGLPSAIGLGTDFVTNVRQHVNAMYAQDDWRVNSKLTVNVGLRWEYATPAWERDNHWANFNPATNSLVLATNGGIYNRALVNPDYKDFGPRIGLAYSVMPKTVIRAGYGISYDFFNRMGSPSELINGPLAIFGSISQPSNPLSPSFLTTQNAFTTGIANPANFNPITSNNLYIPANTAWPMIQSWVFAIQREINRNTVLEVAYNGNHSVRLPIIGDWNQAVPNLPGQTLNVQARVPDPSFGPITWVDPAGNNNYNGLSARFEHRFGHGLYFLNSFTWSHAMGDSEQVLEALNTYQAANPQNIRNLHNEFGPTDFDVKLLNVTSLVYDLPFGKGRQFGANLNPVLNAIIGGWEMNAINTANTGLPVSINYNPSSANDVTGLPQNADYRGVALLRPNVSGSAASQSTAQSLLTYFAGYTFTTPPASAPFGDLGRNAFRAPGLEQWDLGVDKNFFIREKIRLQFRSEFFNVLNHTNFGNPGNVSTSGSFGTITTTYPPRQIQFGLKLMF